MRLEVFAPDRPIEGDLVVVPAGLPGPPTAGALEALRGFAGAGGRLLGLGDGVAWLCAAGLLPGQVRAAPASPTHVRVEGRATPFTWAIPAGRVLPLAAAEASVAYAAPDAEVVDLTARGRVVLRYCDAAGGVDASSRRELGPGRELAPTSSAPGSGLAPTVAACRSGLAPTVAGLSNEDGGVLGLLAPEIASLDSHLGRQILACLRRG